MGKKRKTGGKSRWADVLKSRAYWYLVTKAAQLKADTDSYKSSNHPHPPGRWKSREKNLYGRKRGGGGDDKANVDLAPCTKYRDSLGELCTRETGTLALNISRFVR